MLCLVAQLCQTLCVPMDCSLPGFSVHGDSPGKNIGVNCHALLQGIFSIQGSNPTLPHCSWILYCLNYQRSPRKLEWVAYPFFLGIISIQELNRSLLHCRQILYQLSYQGSPLWPHSHLLFHGQQGQRYCLYQGPAIFPMYIILCCICHGLFQNSGVYMVILLLGLVMNSTQHLLLTEAPRGLLQTP